MSALSVTFHFFLLLFWSGPVWGAEVPSLDQILTKIDQVGNRLNSMQAELEQKKWTDILEEYDDGEEGQFFFMRHKSNVYLRKDIDRPSENNLVINEGEVIFYQPSIKQAQKYSLGKHGDKAEFLILGFGSDKGELRETYNIELLGSETIDGMKTYKLQLTPKSKDVAAFFTRIILWIDSERWIPVQQKLVEPTQDYLLIRFKNIQLNPKLSKSAFEIDLPDDVRIIGGN